jgi:hypothetical protein
MQALIFNKKIKRFLLLAFTSALLHSATYAQKAAPVKSSPDEYFAVEDYYRVKWGHADEFISLWKANHYPLLKKAQEKGDVISIKAETPRLHSGEDTRWDFRVTVVFRTAALAFDENLTVPYKKDLYPDQDAFGKAEQHRFELLLSHWDVEVASIPLN